jgi:hypothetical protein
MSTPEHPTGHDERGFGERLREVVVGESAESERDRTAQHAAAHERDGEENEYAAYEQAMREHVESGVLDGPDRTVDGRDHERDHERGLPVGDRFDDRPAVGDGDRFDGGSRTATDPVPGGGFENQADSVPTRYPDDDPAAGPRGTRTNQGTDTVSDPDDPRGYEPTGDAGFVDERRADAKRTTGYRDTDYDTGQGSASASRGLDPGTRDA